MAKVKKLIKYWVSGTVGYYVAKAAGRSISSTASLYVEAKNEKQAHEKILASVLEGYRKRIKGRKVYAYGRCGYEDRGQMRIMHVLEDKKGDKVLEYHLDEAGKGIPYMSKARHRKYTKDVAKVKR